jgi:hypothetical protein
VYGRLRSSVLQWRQRWLKGDARMKNTARAFFAMWHLLGWTSHVYVAFHTFPVFLGLALPGDSPAPHLLANRLPSLLFVASQVPLLWARFNRSLASVLREARGDG